MHPRDEDGTVTGSEQADANLLVKRYDRNGNIEECFYDAMGREAICVEAAGAPVALATTTAYLPGTELPTRRTVGGDKTTSVYDHRNRQVAVTRQPDQQVSLTTRTAYDVQDRVAWREDPYGRRTYSVYEPDEDRLERTVQETVPGALADLNLNEASDATGTLAREDTLRQLTRDSGLDASYLITDQVQDAEGRMLSRTDARGITDTFEYDHRDRRVASTEAAGTAVAARTETVYDADSNVVEVRTPRVFDSGPEGNANARTVMTYTGRNLLATRTEAPGTAEEATTTFSYFLDGREDTTVDARGNAWAKLWGVCCARIMAVLDPPADVDGDGDPERAATVTRHDFHGNLTHEGRVQDVSEVSFPNVQLTGSNSTDLPDAGTLSETTTRYDARHRPVATTAWMVPLGAVDPDNVPIAGGGLSGDPAVTVGDQVQGLTTTYAYDDDLTDGQGLEVAHAAAINARLGTGFFAAGSDGSAVAVTNPEGETTVRFSDGLGRTVLSVDPTGDASSVDHDEVVTLAGFGPVVQTEQTDPLNHSTARRTDGAGRTLEAEDQLGFVTTYSFDANSNLVSFRDPNGVGEDCGYDLRDRKELCRDTQEIAEGTSRVYGYDANSNLVLTRDAAGTDDTCVYDARDRKTVCTDRVGAVTTYAYDPNSNLASITDGEGGLTSYTYDARNLQTLTVYPNDGSQLNGEDPVGGDRVAMAYDGLRRPAAKTDQAGTVTSFAYDLAGRMTERGYASGDAVLGTPVAYPFDAPGGYTSYRSGTTTHTASEGAPAGGNAVAITSGPANGSLNTGGIRLSDAGIAGLEVGKTYRLRLWARGLDSPGQIRLDHQSGSGGGSNLSRNYNLTTGWQLFEQQVVLNKQHDGIYAWSQPQNGGNYRFALDGLTIEEVSSPAQPTTDTDTFTYDLASRLLEARKGRYGNRVGMTYTDDGLIATETLTLEPGTPGNEDTGSNAADRSFTITRGYDADDRLTSIAYPNGGTVTRTHTARHQLESVGWDGQDVVSLFTYDPGMRETARDLGNGFTRTSGYTRADNLVTSHTVTTTTGTELEELGFSYAYADPNKNLTSETRSGVMASASFTTEHDPGDRLTGWDRTSGETRDWSLNFTGDWQEYSGTYLASGTATTFTQVRTHNPVHEILNVESTTPTPGLAGGAVTHDPKGNITGESTAGQLRSYAFDADNMLTSASELGGASEAGSYTYDALGRRVSKTAGGTTTVFVSMTDVSGMGQVIQEYEDASSTPARSYLYGSYVDEPLAQLVGSTIRYYHRDRQFHVVGLTSGAGTLEELYRYTPYGEQEILAPDGTTVRASSSFHAGQTPGHQGLHHDEESGLIYNRARYRNVELGRWMGRDPLRYIDEKSLYAFVGGHPLFYFDPTGLSRCCGGKKKPRATRSMSRTASAGRWACCGTKTEGNRSRPPLAFGGMTCL